jgi:hypothetical protein
VSRTKRPKRNSSRDDYPTPAWATAAIAPYVPRGSVFDPCAGRGDILDVLRVTGVADETFGFEVVEERAAEAARRGHVVYAQDALQAEWCFGDCIVMNPPFSLAEPFVFRAVATAHVYPVFALLRVGWLEAARRAAWNLAHPSDVYVLSPRPRFVNKRSDAATYAWFVWGLTDGGHVRVLHGGDSAKGVQHAKRFARVDDRGDGAARSDVGG